MFETIEYMLYQYTSIAALSLILKNKTIRFSRLDSVDDPEEYGFTKYDINPAQYTFVSCWCGKAEENIPMWRMYASNGAGVRIGVPERMFDVKYNNGDPFLLPVADFYDKDYFLTPLTRDGQERYPLYDVEYVLSPEDKTDKIFREGNGQCAIDFKEIGKYKNKDWGFQHEKRFLLNAFPKHKNSEKVYSLQKSVSDHIGIEEQYIDIPLSLSAYKTMEILLGPNANESEECVVESLMMRYLGHANLKKSVFAGKMSK